MRFDGRTGGVRPFFSPPGEAVQLPCGQCIGCRLDYSLHWAVRCMHEAQMHDENCFLTLTYSDEHVPSSGSLDKGALQKFWKRLRKRFPERRIRYFACGEYGERLHRPHYHACVFGFDFPDRELFMMREGIPLYTSEALAQCWPFGFCSIGDVTFESAAYVARYACKKITGEAASRHYERIDYETGEIH